MDPLRRHRLVWLTAAGWQRLAGTLEQTPLVTCLAHWAQAELPLVIGTQSTAGAAESSVDPFDVRHLPAHGIGLGLAAPARWNRARIRLRAMPEEIRSVGDFPTVDQALPLLSSAAAEGSSLCRRLADLGVTARVYGSLGWEWLTGLTYVRPESDIDLLIDVGRIDQADAVARMLDGCAGALPRLDGELLFPGGHAVSWREWRAWRAGHARQLLVKTLAGAMLLDRAATIPPAWLKPRRDDAACWPIREAVL